MKLKLHPPPEHTLSEQDAQDLLDQLTKGVGKHVVNRPWQKNISIYARVCFHEAAHAVSSVEHGVKIQAVRINPGEGDGSVTTADVSYRHSAIRRSEIEASIFMSAPAAEALVATVDPDWYLPAIHDMMLARASLEFGADYTENFMGALCRIGVIPSDAASIKEVYKAAKADALKRWNYGAVRRKDEAQARYGRQCEESCAWAYERREVLLEVAIDLAKRRKVNPNINPRGVELAIKRVMRGNPASRPHWSSPEHLSWMIEQNRQRRENVITRRFQ